MSAKQRETQRRVDAALGQRHRPARSVKIHRDGDELNGLIRIDADERDPFGGFTSNFYQLSISTEGVVGQLQFQHGPRLSPKSTPGVTDSAVLAVVIDRFEGFQSGDFACPENARVLDHLYAALEVIQSRRKLREAQGVLGKNEGIPITDHTICMHGDKRIVRED